MNTIPPQMTSPKLSKAGVRVKHRLRHWIITKAVSIGVFVRSARSSASSYFHHTLLDMAPVDSGPSLSVPASIYRLHRLSHNVQRASASMSYDKRLSGLCGLTYADITIALEAGYNTQRWTRRHVRRISADLGSEPLAELTKYANRYLFCNYQVVVPAFNTDTLLGYLEVSHWGRYRTL